MCRANQSELEEVLEEDVNTLLNSYRSNAFRGADRLIIGGCDKNTKLRIVDELSRDLNFLGIVIIPLIDIESIKEIRNS